MIPLTYGFSDLMAGFGLKTPNALRLRLKRLAREGFPPRLPGAPPRWSKLAVDQWLLHWGQQETIQLVPQNITVIDHSAITALRSELESQCH